MEARHGTRSDNILLNFLSELTGACSEMFLIFFLFIISTLSYLSSKFAKYCKLQSPCFLCSRVCRQPWFDGDSVCEAHKAEISSLAFCERHNKLGFAQDLCQRCHLSCSNLIDEKSEKGDCSCCFRKRCNLRNVSKGKEKVIERKEKPCRMNSLIDLEEKVIHASPIPKPNPSIDSDKKINLGESSGVSSSKTGIGHGLEEINWNHFSRRGTGISTGTGIGMRNPNFSATSQPNVLSESPKRNRGSPPRPTISDPCLPKRTPSQISVKRALSNRGSFQSPKPSEIISSKDNLTTEEDIKNLFSQITPTPRLSLRPPPSSTPFDESVNSKHLSVSFERNNSSLDSFEVNMVSDIEGESSVDKLRRQVEMDKKHMRILYEELEQERNASAVAASEAMAMINRLQEEKAGLKMESLQYLRMMEQEAGFDRDEIEKLNNLLSERDNEMWDLEADVEEFKRSFLKFENGLVLGSEEKGFVMERLKWLEERVCRNNGEKQGAELENEKIEEGLKKEVDRLSDRFERIEMDHRFISNVLGAIKQNGDEGIKFVEEIAAHLSELRKITPNNL